MANQSCPTNPAHNNTFYPKNKELFQKSKKAIKPFGIWMETIFREADMDLTEIHKAVILDIPPWTIRTPKINLTFCEFHNPPPLQFSKRNLKKLSRDVLNTYQSKLEKITGCATIHRRKIFQRKKISLMIPIFSTEACTINMAL